jgi:metal-sulfur cluster biosynthetic enzyme
MKKITKKIVVNILKQVLDPELGISIYDLGLIYEITVKGSHVDILMTLTTIGCPLFAVIEEDVRKALLQTSGIKKVSINLTFEPPWSMEMMSEEAKILLGM